MSVKFLSMSIQQTKKLSDLEKRLKLLRQQMYGKENRELSAISYQLSDKNKRSEHRYQPKADGLKTESYPANSDITYLYQDLSKIGILAFFTIGVQIILFILTKNHILNLNFF